MDIFFLKTFINMYIFVCNTDDTAACVAEKAYHTQGLVPPETDQDLYTNYVLTIINICC